jgi:membrane protease YdiL (CAAX protease family)
MTDEGVRSRAEQTDAFATPRAFRDILLVGAPILAFGVWGTAVGVGTLEGGALVNLGYVGMMLVGAALLRRQGSSWRELGLRFPARWGRTALWGLGAFVGAVVVFVALQALAVGVLEAVGVATPALDQSRFNPVEGNPALYALMIVLAWTTIAFGEELFYRAFLLTRLIDLAGVGRWAAILSAGLIFGLVHFAEGPVGVLANTGMGVLFGWIFLRSHRNLWITICGHGLINTFRFTLLFVGLA